VFHTVKARILGVWAHGQSLSAFGGEAMLKMRVSSMRMDTVFHGLGGSTGLPIGNRRQPRNADFKSAVSRVSYPQVASKSYAPFNPNAQPIGNRRYSRLETCATASFNAKSPDFS
jgi:hypothetical protein